MSVKSQKLKLERKLQTVSLIIQKEAAFNAWIGISSKITLVKKSMYSVRLSASPMEVVLTATQVSGSCQELVNAID